jgi:hypothetical protein
MSTWNTTAVDTFLRTVKTARDYNSREIRLSIQDAESLSISLALMLNQERELVMRIMKLQDQLLSVQTPGTNVNFSGGSF